MGDIAHNTVFERAEGAVFRSVAGGGQGVLLNTATGAYHSLNAVGCVVWELIDGRRDVAAVIGEVIGRFEDAPPERVGDDVVTFVADLAERALIVAGGARG